jgi:hypothetical protein
LTGIAYRLSGHRKWDLLRFSSGAAQEGILSSTRDAIETILATAPGFRPRWEAFLTEWQNEDTPWFVAMGDLASYIVECYEHGSMAELPGLFSAVETGFVDGDEKLKELPSIGFAHQAAARFSSHRHTRSCVLGSMGRQPAFRIERFGASPPFLQRRDRYQ